MTKTGDSGNAIFRLQLFAVVTGFVILVFKFAAYFITHSNTILSDAIESIINVVAGGFALFSLYLASRPVDYEHPYGHGKVEFISAGLEGVLIIVAGLIIIGKSVWSFYNPSPLERLDVGLYIILITGVINFALGFALVSTGKKHHSLTLRADGEHLKSDAYSSFGILAGLILIITTRINVLDNAVAIIFGVVIIYMGLQLTRKSVAGIMDEADSAAIETLVELLNRNRKPEWIDVHNLRLIQFGNKFHVDCHVTLPWYYTLKQSHHVISDMASIINKESESPVEFFIHTDPCIKEQCNICTVFDCKVRQAEFSGKIDWTEQNVRRNKRHGLH